MIMDLTTLQFPRQMPTLLCTLLRTGVHLTTHWRQLPPSLVVILATVAAVVVAAAAAFRKVDILPQLAIPHLVPPVGAVPLPGRPMEARPQQTHLHDRAHRVR